MLFAKRISAICLISTFLSASFNAFAYDTLYESMVAGNFVYKLQGGIGWLNSEETSTIDFTATEFQTVDFDDTPVTAAISSGIGYYFPFRYDNYDVRWFPGVMLSGDASYLFQTHLSGDVYDEMGFLVGSNQTQVKSATALLNVTLPVLDLYRWGFFVLGGFGAAWTWVQYEDQPIDGVPPSDGFSLDEETNTTFAYQAGAGISYEVLTTLDITLMYLYADLGEMKTANTVSTSHQHHHTLKVNPAEFNLRQQSVLLGFQWNIF